MPGVTPVVNDHLQARVESSAGDQISLNILHYRVVSQFGGGLTLQQMATQMVASWNALYRALMPVSATFQFIEVKNLEPPQTVAYRATSSAAGTAIGDLLPRQVSCLLSTSTALAGRNMRGRAYVGLISDTFADAAGELTGAGFALLTNLATAVGPDVALTIGAAGCLLKLVVRHPDTLGPIIVPQSTDVVHCSASTGFATQRRRGDFGRSNRP